MSVCVWKCASRYRYEVFAKLLTYSLQIVQAESQSKSEFSEDI